MHDAYMVSHVHARPHMHNLERYFVTYFFLHAYEHCCRLDGVRSAPTGSVYLDERSCVYGR